MTTISSKQVTTYMNNGQTRILRKLGPSIARRNEFSQKLSSLVPLKEQLYLRVMEEVHTVIRIRNDKKWRHFLCLEGWRGDIGEMDEDSQKMIWSDGVLVHSEHIYRKHCSYLVYRICTICMVNHMVLNFLITEVTTAREIYNLSTSRIV